MEKLSDAVDRLTAAGYREEYSAASGGLRAAKGGGVTPVERFAIDEVLRFEGTSDPAAQTILFALRHLDDGTRGTYLAAYGPEMAPEDADMVKALEAARGG